MIESERKYLGASRPSLRRLLKSLGAISEGLHFESNVVFDTSGHSLLAAGKLLRLRSQEWPDRRCAILTFKRPAPGQALVKTREELETGIGDGRVLAAILSGLGFRPVARYEKLREQWHFAQGSAWDALCVDLDTLPFGFVVEIEGAPGDIDRLAQALALDKNGISLKTYHELNQEWRRSEGLPASSDLLFEARARRRLRTAIGLD
ncbi:MAG: class IV adenylate cyclase [Desulfovibrio sp.]|nr:class IV adenylate cyclase [Desulfovibrio sp.]